MSQASQIDHPAQLWQPPKLGAWLQTAEVAKPWLLKVVGKEGEVQGFLPMDSKVLVSGRPKISQKSFFVSAMSIAVASGKDVGPDGKDPIFISGNPGVEMPVLSLAAEGARSFTRDRWYWIGNGLSVQVEKLPIFYGHRDPITLEDPRWAEVIGRFIEAQHIKFIIIDPLVMFMQGDENKQHEIAKVMRVFTAWCELGATVLFVHHLGKPQKDFQRDIDDEIRGSSAIAGFYDIHYALRQNYPGQKTNNLTYRAKDDEERRFVTEWKIDRGMGEALFTLEQVDDFSVPPESYQEDLLEKLRKTNKTSFRASDLSLLWDVQDVTHLANILIRAGKLHKDGYNYML